MTTDQINVLRSPSTILIIIYLIFLSACFVLFQVGGIPYPYTKAPLGFILSVGTAFIACIPWLLKSKKNKINSGDMLYIVGFTFFLLFLQKLLPLNLAEFHITTNVSRVSLISGHITNIAFWVSIHLLKQKKAPIEK
jgi:hypothetical protein